MKLAVRYVAAFARDVWFAAGVVCDMTRELIGSGHHQQNGPHG